jgi:hypothetical protein
MKEVGPASLVVVEAWQASERREEKGSVSLVDVEGSQFSLSVLSLYLDVDVEYLFFPEECQEKSRDQNMRLVI